jgi:hypothetical protein
MRAMEVVLSDREGACYSLSDSFFPLPWSWSPKKPEKEIMTKDMKQWYVRSPVLIYVTSLT